MRGCWRRHLLKIVNDPKKRIEIKDLRAMRPVLLPPGRLSHEVIAPEQAYRGDLSATLSVSDRRPGEEEDPDQRPRRDLRRCPGGARFLQRHHEIREKDVQWVNRNVALLANDVVTEMGEVLNHRTTLSINGQEVFRKGMVEMPPLVKRGDRVIMSVENHRFKITTWGEVKEEGRRGDRIRLVNLSSRKEVFGRVLDEHGPSRLLEREKTMRLRRWMKIVLGCGFPLAFFCTDARGLWGRR